MIETIIEMIEIEIMKKIINEKIMIYDFKGIVISEGVLELMQDGYGFLRSADFHYLSSPDDVYVSQSQVKFLDLKLEILLKERLDHQNMEKGTFPLVEVEKINGREPGIY